MLGDFPVYGVFPDGVKVGVVRACVDVLEVVPEQCCFFLAVGDDDS